MSGAALPPKRVWVSYCTTCGTTILADPKKLEVECPDCPRSRGRIRYARYALVVD